MPDLIGNHNSVDNKPLCWTFNLLSVEHAESWEGWLRYEVKLSRAEDVIASSTNLTIHADDIVELCDRLNTVNKEEFEPVEPDFRVLVHRSDTGVELSVFLDEGRRQSVGYTGQGVGLRLIVDETTIHKFSRDIKDQYERLTESLSRVE